MDEDENKYKEMIEKFQEVYPLDAVFSTYRTAELRLRIYEYIELRRIADALEKISEKK